MAAYKATSIADLQGSPAPRFSAGRARAMPEVPLTLQAMTIEPKKVKRA